MSPPILDPIRGALLRSQPDSRLVTLVREGRERAFEELVRRYRAPLVGFAAMIVPADRADDVVQEALLAAYGSLVDSDAEIVLRPWLFRIVRNRALNDLRDTPAADPLPEDLDGVAQPSEIAERNEQVAALLGGLHALPDQQREAIVARELEGRGHAEIAAELGTSTGAVRQLIFRARGALREAAGVLIPLPLLRALLGPGGAETGAAATTAGVAALAGGGAAAGVGTKVAVGLAGVAIAVGGGLAIERSRDGGGDGRDEAGRGTGGDERLASSGPRGEGGSDDAGASGSSSGGPGSGHGQGEGVSEGGGEGGDDGGGGSSGSGGGGNSGPGGGGGDFDDDGGGGDLAGDDNSGSGSTSSGSGSGSSGSGSSGSVSSGSGSSGSGDDDFEPIETEIEDPYPSGNSGSSSISSGSGSSGSGSSGSDSSGSGSDGDDDEIDD